MRAGEGNGGGLLWGAHFLAPPWPTVAGRRRVAAAVTGGEAGRIGVWWYQRVTPRVGSVGPRRDRKD